MCIEPSLYTIIIHIFVKHKIIVCLLTLKCFVMKNLIYLFCFATLLSCRTLDKMVETGDYDRAMVASVNRMAGDKSKKTKHVKALEKAFAHLRDKELNQARRFEQLGGENWAHAARIYKGIEERQELIRPFLPLTSKDGYTATFTFVNTAPLISQAKEKAGLYYFNSAQHFLTVARNGDKNAAQQAYRQLESAKAYLADKNNEIDKMRREAKELGTTHILVNVRNASNIIIPKRVEEMIVGISVADLNNSWHTFHTHPYPNVVDINATLVIDFLAISPEREFVKQWEESKEIEDGWEYVLDEKGNVAKDTLGNDIKKPVMSIVKAQILEVNREKIAEMRGAMHYTDAKTGEKLHHNPVNVVNAFRDSQCQFVGDIRAICAETKSKINRNLLPFPSNEEMTFMAAEEMKQTLKHDLRNFTRR